jgi:type 1 fimbriae regulatory protein FimB/type 1 fimbriae regulatory protein FimE
LNPPIKQKSSQPRKYLLEHEIEQLIKAAKQSKRHGNRNATLILLMFRHGLRTAEAVNLRWQQIDLREGLILVQRVKNSRDGSHPLRGRELRGLRQIQRDYDQSPYVFQSERKTTLSSRAVRDLIQKCGAIAELPFPISPHMLRHGCGYYLANRGEDTRAIQDYLGHKNITNTEIYTKLSAKRFESFWRD